MFRNLVAAALALLTAACVPIPAEPPPAAEPPAASESSQGPRITLASENLSDCPERDEISPIGPQVVPVVNFLEMLPGQSASDPVANNIPAYVDMVRVETSLEGETLTAVFHLREIPEELEFNRKGFDHMSAEYMWMILIDADGEEALEFERYEYTFGAFSNLGPDPAQPQSAFRLFEDGVRIFLWEHQPSHEENVTNLIDVPVEPWLLVSHEEDTLTLISEVPGITSESVLLISTYDILLGHDGVSCQPG